MVGVLLLTWLFHHAERPPNSSPTSQRPHSSTNALTHSYYRRSLRAFLFGDTNTIYTNIASFSFKETSFCCKCKPLLTVYTDRVSVCVCCFPNTWLTLEVEARWNRSPPVNTSDARLCDARLAFLLSGLLQFRHLHLLLHFQCHIVHPGLTTPHPIRHPNSTSYPLSSLCLRLLQV